MQTHALRRREFKYLISPDLVPAIASLVRPTCVPDPHAGFDGTYRIRSLYLDTPDLRLFKANEREAPERYKARVRSYPDGRGRSPVFFEIKRRTHDIIRKSRHPVAPELLDEHLRARPCAAHWTAAWGQFAHRLHLHQLRPTVLVEYRRRAWMSQVDDYARVSVDTEVSGQACEDWTLGAEVRRWRSIDHRAITHTPGSVAILELKFANAAPSWMVGLVRALDLMRQSYSKYCHAIQAQAQPLGQRIRRSA